MTQENENQLEVYLNGEFVPENEAKISVFDHGLLYGDGVYDTLCGWNGYIFKLEQHIDRLYRSAHTIKMQIPLKKEELLEKVVEVAKRSKQKNLYLKCYITRGYSEKPLLDPRGCVPTVVIFGKPYLWLLDSEKSEKGITAKITNIRRTPDQCLDGKIKNLNYLNIIMAKMEAIESGYDEAIMPGLDGSILEGPGYNVFMVSNGKVISPPTENILVGITRETCFEIAKEIGLESAEQKITSHDIYNADEVFLSSTAGGVIGVREIDHRMIGTGQTGPVTKRIRENYFKRLENGVNGTKYL